MADKYDTYSDVEDDVEIRCEDSYSPTDGLFGNRQHPRDTFVQSPTAIVHAKHTEANKAGLSEGSPQQQPLETVYEYQRFAPTSPARTRTNVNDRTPLLHDAPPPAYSGPQNVACPTIAWAEERGAVATHSPLFPARLPQSMCGLIRVPDDEPERDSYKYPRIWSRFKVTCKWVLEILCGILVVLLVLLILLEALMGSKMKDISKACFCPLKLHRVSLIESRTPCRDLPTRLRQLQALPAIRSSNSSSRRGLRSRRRYPVTSFGEGSMAALASSRLPRFRLLQSRWLSLLP